MMDVKEKAKREYEGIGHCRYVRCSPLNLASVEKNSRNFLFSLFDKNSYSEDYLTESLSLISEC